MPPPGPASGTAAPAPRCGSRPPPVAGHRRQPPRGVDGEDEPAGDDRRGQDAGAPVGAGPDVGRPDQLRRRGSAGCGQPAAGRPVAVGPVGVQLRGRQRQPALRHLRGRGPSARTGMRSPGRIGSPAAAGEHQRRPEGGSERQVDRGPAMRAAALSRRPGRGRRPPAARRRPHDQLRARAASASGGAGSSSPPPARRAPPRCPRLEMHQRPLLQRQRPERRAGRGQVSRVARRSCASMPARAASPAAAPRARGRARAHRASSASARQHRRRAVVVAGRRQARRPWPRRASGAPRPRPRRSPPGASARAAGSSVRNAARRASPAASAAASARALRLSLAAAASTTARIAAPISHPQRLEEAVEPVAPDRLAHLVDEEITLAHARLRPARRADIPPTSDAATARSPAPRPRPFARPPSRIPAPPWSDGGRFLVHRVISFSLKRGRYARVLQTLASRARRAVYWTNPPKIRPTVFAAHRYFPSIPQNHTITIRCSRFEKI